MASYLYNCVFYLPHVLAIVITCAFAIQAIIEKETREVVFLKTVVILAVYVVQLNTATEISYCILDHEHASEVWAEHSYNAFELYLLILFLLVILFVTAVKHYSRDENERYGLLVVGCLFGYVPLICSQIASTLLLYLLFHSSSNSRQQTQVTSNTIPETCTNEWINIDNITGLQYAFRGHLYGQHLVEYPVASSMYAFFKNENPPRPLVLSFHGRTGTGKNHVSRLIAESVYKKGLGSKYVHLKLPGSDFPHQTELRKYKDNLQKEIHSSVSQCARQLFIFDEVENLPEGLLDAIKPYIDYHDEVHGVDFRKSIFIFLSNIGGREITDLALNHIGTRESLRISSAEKVIEMAAFNQKGAGLYHSRLMDSHLVGHFIPFLPLEKQHVELCIRAEFMKLKLPPPSDATISDVLDELQFWPEDTKKYAVKGCKNVWEKAALIVYTRNEL